MYQITVRILCCAPVLLLSLILENVKGLNILLDILGESEVICNSSWLDRKQLNINDYISDI